MADPAFAAPLPSVVPSPKTYASSFPSWLAPVGSALDTINAARERLNLPDPGKAEDFGREAKTTQLNNYMFDGARADISKIFSHQPAFQVTHNFTAGSQGGPMGGISPGTYSFGAAYITPAVFAHGTIDGDGSLQGRFIRTWSPSDVTKLQTQLPGSGNESMIVLEHDHVGKDYSVNVKSQNANFVDLTGTYLGTYLQSVTPNFALGVEAVYQRPTPEIEDCALGYLAKWHSVKTGEQGQPLKDSWIATAQVSAAQGVLQGSYWRKLAERVDACVDLVMLPSLVPTERKAVAQASLKYDFRAACVRGQVDSEGKVSVLLEQRIAPPISFLLSGEIDHVKNTSKFGVGITLESQDEAVMEAAQAAAQAGEL